jgi:hypothetical protein
MACMPGRLASRSAAALAPRFALGLAIGLAAGCLLARAAAAGPCIGNYQDDFSDGVLGPLYAPVGSCGATTETGGALQLAKSGGCVGVTGIRSNNAVGQICGDFDIRVDFDLGSFPAVSSSGGRFHSLLVYSSATNALIGGVEHYREQANACIPYNDSRKAYTNNPGCPPDGVYVPDSLTQGSLRLRRQGTTLEAYYKDTGPWQLILSRAVPSDPVRVQLNSGTNGSLQTGHVASFDNLSIQSATPVPALPPTVIALLGLALAAGGSVGLARSRQR